MNEHHSEGVAVRFLLLIVSTLFLFVILTTIGCSSAPSSPPSDDLDKAAKIDSQLEETDPFLAEIGKMDKEYKDNKVRSRKKKESKSKNKKLRYLEEKYGIQRK